MALKPVYKNGLPVVLEGQALEVEETGGTAGNRWTLQEDVTLTEAVDAYSVSLNQPRRAAVVVFPQVAVTNGWKKIAINGQTIPVYNGRLGDNDGLVVQIDLDAPNKIMAYPNVQCGNPLIYGAQVSTPRISTVLPAGVMQLDSLALQTAELLVAGCNIKVYTGG